jgi:MFS family permease
MRATFLLLWPVIAAVALIQIANGVQSDLVGVRAGIEHFPAWTIGVVMSCYYVGYSTAPLLSRRIIAHLGHAATIATATLLAAGLIVLHAYAITPLLWGLFRICLGLSLSLVYVAIESWINDVVENARRGRVFSAYVFVQMVSMTLSQAIFGLGNPRNASLFLIAGVLFAMGAIPLLGLRGAAQMQAPPEPLALTKIFQASPLGAIATVVAGLSWAVIVTFGPVYAQQRGLSTAQIGLLMGFAMAGGMILQVPFGWLSDHIGRRPTLALMSAGAVIAALFGLWADGHGVVPKYIAFAFEGGFVFTLYAIAVARTNDAIAPSNRVAAAAGLVMLFGLGSFGGPLISGYALTLGGPSAFFAVVAAIMSVSLAAAAISR